MNQNLASRIHAANAALIVDGDLDAVSEYFAADYVAHLTGEDFTGGHATVRKIVGMYRRSFPDVRVDVDILATDDDRIAWQRTLRATHEAAFKGFPATGQTIV